MQRQLTYNGSTLFYHCSGDGAALVLLHGFGEDSSIWRFQKVFLEPHFKILIPDLPGTGPSQQIPDMSMEGLADAVHALLQQEGIERCIVIGHSMGGYITLAFVEKYSHLLQGFGLFESSAFADNDEKINTRKKGIAFIQQHGTYNFLKTSIPNLYSPATKQQNPALLEQQIENGRSFSKEALVAYYEAMIKRPDRTEVLRRSNVPVFFALGRHDTAVPLESGLAQCHLPQIAYIHVLEHSGHMGMVEEPERSNTILSQYLSETFGLL